MLVLSRKLRQRIVIGDGEVVVEIVGVKGDKVRVGIEAPPTVRVVREEIVEETVERPDDTPSAETAAAQADAATPADAADADELAAFAQNLASRLGIALPPRRKRGRGQ